MKTKQCSKCKQYKSIDHFSRDSSKKSGLRSQCKACYREYVISRQGKTVLHKANKRYFATKKGKQTKQRYRMRMNNSRNQKARYLTRLEIRTRRLPHPTELKCEQCNKQATEYHHKDYGKPLDVTPLCQKCHIETHGGVMT